MNHVNYGNYGNHIIGNYGNYDKYGKYGNYGKYGKYGKYGNYEPHVNNGFCYLTIISLVYSSQGKQVVSYLDTIKKRSNII